MILSFDEATVAKKSLKRVHDRLLMPGSIILMELKEGLLDYDARMVE